MRALTYLFSIASTLVLQVDFAAAHSLTVNVSVRINGFYDPGNVLNGVTVGQTGSGSFTYETSTLDEVADPNTGWYPQTSSQAHARFSFGSLTFESDEAASYSPSLVLVLPDQNLFQFNGGANRPLANGATVEALQINIQGILNSRLASDALPQVASEFTPFVSKLVLFAGELNGNRYQLWGEITEMETLEEGLLVSPSSGLFFAQQRFDAALLLPRGSQVREVQMSRGGVSFAVQCYPAVNLVQSRNVMMCPDAQSVLQPGAPAGIEWRVLLQDDSVLTKSVNWEVAQ